MADGSIVDRKRRRPQVVDTASITKKRFRKVANTQKRIDVSKVINPSIVAMDLRRGSLESLYAYLAQCGGIVDPRVISAFLRLLPSSLDQGPFQVAVTRNPKLPPNAHSGKMDEGRAGPKKPSTQRQIEIAEFYEASCLTEPKNCCAIDETMKRFYVSETKVREDVKRWRAERDATHDATARAQEAEQDAMASNARREKNLHSNPLALVALLT